MGQRKKKDPNAPKRPMSAYFLFMNATRPTVRKENPDASIGEVAKILGKMWGEIEPEDKAKYDKDAAAAKKKWEAEKAAYAKKGKLLRRLRKAETKKTKRRRRPRTANRKIVSKETKAWQSCKFTPEEEQQKPEPFLYFDTSSLKYVCQNAYFDRILFKIRIFKIRTLKYLSS